MAVQDAIHLGEDDLPFIDIGRHHPGRRLKRSLRFSWDAVLRWYGQEGGGQ